VGRVTKYSVQRLPGDDEKRVITFPNQLQSILTRNSSSEALTLPTGMTMSAARSPDPRWRMQAPLVSEIVRSPSRLTSQIKTSRTVTLADEQNSLRLTQQVDTVEINGRSYRSIYEAACRTFTYTTPEGRPLTLVIDSQGRLLSKQIGNLATIRYSYDSRGRLATITQGSGVDTRTSIFAYNCKAHLSTLTDPLNHTATFEYDAAGRVFNQTLPGGRTIGYGYDKSGNLHSLTQPHTFTHTPIDFELTHTAPAVNGGGTNRTEFTHNLDRQLVEIEEPDAQQSVGFIRFVSSTNATQATGLLTITPGGTNSH
jgi:YD repeat-containing protein